MTEHRDGTYDAHGGIVVAVPDRAEDAPNRAPDVPEGRRCPICGGRGYEVDVTDDAGVWMSICGWCDGSGTVARR